MRSMMLAVALALTAMSGPASAQLGGEAEMMVVYQQLQSAELADRQRAVEVIERNPGNYPPVLVFALVPVLVDLNRDEDALRWKYFAHIRMLSDLRLMMQTSAEYRALPESSFDELVQALQGQIPDIAQVTPERRRRLFQEAMRLDERTPRLYALGFPYGASGATWPSREEINRARSIAVASVRAALEDEIALAESLIAIDREIAARGVAREAEQFIPEAWRGRVRALRSVRMDDFCGAPTFTPTPAGARPAAFVVSCSDSTRYPFGRREQAEERIRWLADDTLAQIADLRTPRPYWRGQVAVRGGVAQAMFQSTDGEDLSLIFLNADGGVSVMTTPGGETIINSLSPSGRYALRYLGAEAQVLDLETNTVLYRHERPAPPAPGTPRTRQTRFAYIAEPGNGQVLAVGYDWSLDNEGSVLVVIDARTGRTQRLDLQNTIEHMLPTAWGDDQALVTFQQPPAAAAPTTVENYSNVEEYEAARERARRERRPTEPGAQLVGIVDLTNMRLEWTGAFADVPPPRRGHRCGVATRFGYMDYDMPASARPGAQVATTGGTFALKVGQRGLAQSCAISGDGEHLVIVAPPFVHHYAVSAN